MTTPPEQRITFELQPDAAAIVQRAALALGLRVRSMTSSNGLYRVVVVLNEPIDAYRLGERTAGDPAWAKEFLRR